MLNFVLMRSAFCHGVDPLMPQVLTARPLFMNKAYKGHNPRYLYNLLFLLLMLAMID